MSLLKIGLHVQLKYFNFLFQHDFKFEIKLGSNYGCNYIATELIVEVALLKIGLDVQQKYFDLCF